MTGPGSSAATQLNDRGARIARVIEDVAARRIAGEVLPDDRIVAANSDLLPELAAELRELQHVMYARQRAAARTPDDSIAALLGTLPGYADLRERYRGGQAVVYEATQASTRRPVAIKVMRGGPFASPRDHARFEQEVHILAQLRHPNIVTVHDSGSVAGCAYFVMDFIPGRPLDEYVAHARLDQRKMLALFAKVCEAVNVAHLRGVIHRDLKPSNIRVDPNGEPHVLDFGLAKVSEFDAIAEGREQSMTATGQFVGSMPWASPEQASGRPGAIDVRTDVYSLGVMLYYLLTGRYPYDVFGNIRDVLDNILRVEPARPSSVGSRINHELETIVLKCLAKEQARRYQSAGELARDIRHYLAGEPIAAKRDSALYVLRKTAQRHKFGVGVAAMILVIVIGSSVALFALYREAAAQSVIAGQQRDRAEKQATIAENEKDRAETEVEKSLRVQKFLADLLSAANPEEAVGQDVTVRQVLDDAAGRIDVEVAEFPDAEGSIRSTLGRAYQSLGLYDEAEAQLVEALALLRETLGEDHTETITAMHNLALLRWKQGRMEEAIELVRAELAACERSLPPEHEDRLTALNALGVLLQQVNQHAEAEQVLREVVDLRGEVSGDDHPDTLIAVGNLAMLLVELDRAAEAEPLMRDVLDAQRRTLGDDHPATLGSINNLGGLVRMLGRDEDAAALYKEAADGMARVFGADHPDTLTAQSNVAMSLLRQERMDEAETLMREVLDARRRVLGNEHMDTLNSVVMLGRLLSKTGDAAAAEPMLREAVETAERTLPPGHPYILAFRNNLGGCLLELQRFDEAEPHLVASFEGFRDALGPEHPMTQSAIGALIKLYDAWGRPDAAAPYRAMLPPAAAPETSPGD